MPEEKQEEKSTIKFSETERQILIGLSRSVEALGRTIESLNARIDNISEQIVLSKKD